MRIDYPDDEDHLKSQQQQISQVGEHPQATGHARKRLQPAAAPKEIACSTDLPRTRSGKIMRRLLRVRELGLPDGDLSTLGDAPTGACNYRLPRGVRVWINGELCVGHSVNGDDDPAVRDSVPLLLGRSAWLPRHEDNGNAVAAAPKIFEKFNPAQPPPHIYVDDQAIVAGESAVGEKSFGGREILYDVTRRLTGNASCNQSWHTWRASV
jgi:hypothetical protein